MDAELRKGMEFAEFAEAVGIPTSQVIALTKGPSDEAFVLIYTPEPLPVDDPDGCDTTAWTVGLGRDRDGIVRVVVDATPTPWSVETMCRALTLGVD